MSARLHPWLLIVATFMVFVDVGMSAILAHPNGLGLVIALSVALVGAQTIHSLMRDRL